VIRLARSAEAIGALDLPTSVPDRLPAILASPLQRCYRPASMRSLVAPISLAALLTSCAQPSLKPATSAPQSQGVYVHQPPPRAEPPADRPELAVLPIDDDDLYRAERAALRAELAGRLATLSSEFEVLALTEVDEKLREVSKKSGRRCAFQGTPARRRARDAGLLGTELMHVAGLPDGKGEALWVVVEGNGYGGATFEGPYGVASSPVERYRKAFAGLARIQDPGLLGGLGASGDLRLAVRQGALTVCERTSAFQCDPRSVDWKDSTEAITACFAGAAEESRDMLVQGDSVGRYCEMANLDDTIGREHDLEGCLCKAMSSSAAFTARPRRRSVRVRFEAADIAQRTRPELRVVESTTNLHAEEDWHSVVRIVDGKEQYRSLKVICPVERVLYGCT